MDARLVDVEAVLPRRKSGDLTSDLGGVTFGGEGHGAGDSGSANKNANLRSKQSKALD